MRAARRLRRGRMREPHVDLNQLTQLTIQLGARPSELGDNCNSRVTIELGAQSNWSELLELALKRKVERRQIRLSPNLLLLSLGFDWRVQLNSGCCCQIAIIATIIIHEPRASGRPTASHTSDPLERGFKSNQMARIARRPIALAGERGARVICARVTRSPHSGRSPSPVSIRSERLDANIGRRRTAARRRSRAHLGPRTTRGQLAR